MLIAGFLFLSLIPALYGLYLLVDFCVWRIGGDVIEGEVTGFRKQRNKRQPLPIVRIPDEDGATRALNVSRIDQISALFNPLIKGQVVRILVLKKNNETSVLYGFFAPLCAAVFLMPFMVVLGFWIGDQLFAAQSLYALILILIIFGGMAGIKLIQKGY